VITGIYGVLDSRAGTWSYATAGHCPAILRRADGTVELLDTSPDPPLGIAREFRPHTAAIGSHATLVLYTDGLVERRTEPLTAGIERLRHACSNGPTDAEALSDHLLEVMLHDSANQDDVALLIISTDAPDAQPVE
jgi:serine phosphatase RsbU (regulator of sigma subunit)